MHAPEPRLRNFLRRTRPLDGVAFLILLIFVLVQLVEFFGYGLRFSGFLSFIAIFAVIYFIVRLTPWVRAQLLWRLRNRLIVAYIFMAVVPVVLLLTMAGLAAYLLELQVGAHLLQDNLQERISVLATDTNAIASALDKETAQGAIAAIPPPVARSVGPAATQQPDQAARGDQRNPPASRGGDGGRGGNGAGRGGRGNPAVQNVLSQPEVADVVAAARAEWPDMRILINGGRNLLADPAKSQVAGFIEYQNRLFFAAARRLSGPDTSLLIVAPVTSDILDKLPANLGPIRLTLLEPAESNVPDTIKFGANSYTRRDVVLSNSRVLPNANHWFDLRIDGIATFQAVKADQPVNPESLPVLAQFSTRVMLVNRDLLTSVGDIGPVLVEVLLIVGAIFLVLELAALTTGVVMTRTITRSVGDLYDATLRVRQGDLTHLIRTFKKDQLGTLAQSFNDMTGSINSLIDDQRKKQRLENEVSIAREVQQQLFPSSIPVVPGIEMAAVCRPAQVVSGDYYDFIPLGPNRVGIALADISGKGIAAALLMASLQAALRSTAMQDQRLTTDAVANRLNSHLFKNSSDDRYATLFYAVYDAGTKTFEYTNAGHLPPILVSSEKVEQLECGGTVVGLFESTPFVYQSLTVKPGTVIVAFSDGLTEAENVYGEEFGVARLKDELLRECKKSPEAIADALIAAAERWAGTPEQMDDMTVVVAKIS